MPFKFKPLRIVGDTITEDLASNSCSTGIEAPRSYGVSGFTHSTKQQIWKGGSHNYKFN